MIALSGSLGVPLSWLRLSVVGALQYELNVAEIAATGMGLSGLKVSEMSIWRLYHHSSGYDSRNFKRHHLLHLRTEKISGQGAEKRKKKNDSGRPGFGTYATIAMFIGLCSAYIGSYVGTWTAFKNSTPLLVAGISALAMAVFEYLIVKKKMEWLENFSIAVSMIIGMAAAVLINL